MARCIKGESELVSELVNFRWKIGNFSADKLPKDGSRMKSPTFKCFNSTLHLEICLGYKEDQYRMDYDSICLYLVQCSPDEPPWISNCRIGFAASDNLLHFKTFSAPTRHDKIFCYFLTSAVTEDCVSDNVLNIHCDFTATTLMRISDDESRSEMNAKKGNEFSKSGPLVLAENIGKIFEHFRLSDVTLKVGEKEFPAHKIILASRSKVFDGMFESGMKENQENVVQMVEMKASIAKEMLEYIYTGKIGKLSMDRALDLYVAADRYDLQELRGWCNDFILQNISPHDVCHVAELAELHNDEKLVKTARRVFKENFKIIMASKEWRHFATKNPVLYSDLLERALLNES